MHLAISDPGPFDGLLKEKAPNSVAAPPVDQRRVRRLGSLSAVSKASHDMFDIVQRLAPSDVTMTLIGETGTGKDVIAHAIHDTSARANMPFVVFDCGAVPPNLIESELFGHERGSFTGATSDYPGAFERCSGGTLFLDEIGELPLDLQPRLLRVLEHRAVRRVGGARDRRVEVRIVAATNRDLTSMMTAKLFRQDLYFRLAGAVVYLPPLRDRFEDLPLLVPRLLQDLGRGDIIVDGGLYPALRAHAWPGNVRELKNALACALAFVDGNALEPRHLRFLTPSDDGSFLDHLPLGGMSLAEVERVTIKQTLRQTEGNKAQASKLLGIAVSTLYEKLKKYGE